MKEYAVAPIHTNGVAYAPCRTSGCNLGPALDLDDVESVDPPRLWFA